MTPEDGFSRGDTRFSGIQGALPGVKHLNTGLFPQHVGACTRCLPPTLQVLGRHLDPRCPDAVPERLCHKGELWAPLVVHAQPGKDKKENHFLLQARGDVLDAANHS